MKYRFCWPSPAVRMITPMPSGMLISRRMLLQALAFLRVFDFARNAALIGIGQQNQVASGQDQVGRHARPLGADRAFGHLHDDFAARADKGGECPFA